MKKLFIALMLATCYVNNAQQSINASGGNGTGTGGSVSYSVGQLDYVSATGSNGSISQGVEQPFEIFALATNDYPNIILQASVYPNPTTENVSLLVSSYSLGNLEFMLYDISGKTISKQKITTAETSISMENLSAGNYFIAVNENNKNLKILKIIKK